MAIESSDLIKGAVTGVIGLVGTLVTVGVSWVKDRDAEAQRLRLLELSTKRLEFWELWLKIQLSLEPNELQKKVAVDQVRDQTFLVQDRVEKGFQVSLNAIEQRTQMRGSFEVMRDALPAWRRWLLFYKPGRAVAWISRVFFWIYSVEGLLAPIALLDRTSVDRVKGYEVIVGGAGMEVFALILWFVSRAVEKPKLVSSGS